jgi:hypothetical protein
MQLDKKKLVIDKVREGCTWDEAAKAGGVHRVTIWRWTQADPEFAKAIEEAKAGPDAEVEAVTFANATDPDPANNTLRMFWLKSRKRAQYGEHATLGIQGDGTSVKAVLHFEHNGFGDGTNPPDPGAGGAPASVPPDSG